jgi:hypothetical protein
MTPRHRFTIMPFLMAFFAALAWLPATDIVKVNARGLGIEHEQPWRRPADGLVAAAHTFVMCLRSGFDALRRHTVFRPAVTIAAALLLTVIDQHLGYAAPVMFGALLSEGRHAGEFILEERGGPGQPSRENVTVLSGQNLKAGAVIGRVNKGVGRVSVPTVVGTGNGTVNTVFASPEAEVGNYVLTCTSAVTHGGVFSLVAPSGKVLRSLTMTPGAGGSTNYRSRHINFTIVDGSTDFIVGDAFTFVVSTTAPLVVGTGNGTVSAITLGPDARTGNYRLEITAAITNGGEFKLTGPDGDIVEQGFIVAGAGGTFVGTNKRQINFTLTEGSTDFAVGDAFNICVFNELAGGKVVAWDPTTFDGRDDAAGLLYDNVDASAADKAGVIVTRDAVVMKSALEWAAAITAGEKESAYKDLAARGVVAR